MIATPHLFRASLLLLAALFFAPEGGAVTVIAHRGDSFHEPENTIRAFESASKKGADLVELDSQVTKDGQLIVFHDGTLDKKSDADEIRGATGIRVADLTLDQIKALDVGAWKNPALAGTKIPTLEESIRTIQKGSITLLERKNGSALAHTKLLERMNLTHDLVVQAFDWEFLAAMRTWNPEIQLGALGGADVTRTHIEDLKRARINLAVWNAEKITAGTISMFKDEGMEIWVYTVNEPKDWKRLVEIGIDGIITDKPAELRQWLAEQG